MLLALLLACTGDRGKGQYVIAASLGMTTDAWQETLLIDMKVAAADYDGLTLRIADAKDDNARQIAQIRSFIRQHVDALIISPNESEPLTPVAVEAYRAGIPTIIIDRKIHSDEYTASISSDNYEIGRVAGIFARNRLPAGAHILEIRGRTGSSPAFNRHRGFVAGLAHRPDLTLESIDGKWTAEATAQATDTLSHPERFDLIFAHSDLMALTAREQLERRVPEAARHMLFLGVNALPGKGQGIEAVAEGKLTASFYNPVSGAVAIHTAMQVLHGKKVPHNRTLSTGIVDADNAGTLYLQAQRLSKYQEQIDKLQGVMARLVTRYRFLESSLFTILVLMAAILGLAAYIYHIDRKIRKKNRLLYQSNQQIEQQREELARANSSLEQATAQKLQFFTNVSHEMRTPLTLILSPLNKISRETPSDSPLAEDIHIMEKNAARLKRVIDQLLDFRKIESNKMTLCFTPVDLNSFLAEVKSCFDKLAEERHIRYTFDAEVAEAPAWVDADKIEKILMNLLSNAFKFTPDGGTIAVRLLEAGERWVFTVTDNGYGISAEELPAIFGRFFTGTQSQGRGTGIGLHLTREFVLLHRGTIRAESVPGVHTCFRVTLPKGEPVFGEVARPVADNGQPAETAPADPGAPHKPADRTYPYTLLITEDDPDISHYLKDELKGDFHLLFATNGQEALEMLGQQKVDLVISDVIMPVMNGFELCRHIKESPDYGAIPVILLTALSDDSQRLSGIAQGADDYIQKPFLIERLRTRILQLLEGRRLLRESFGRQREGAPGIFISLEKVESVDNLFLKKFLSLVEKNYNNPRFNVERGSEQLGFSRVHLYRKVKELTGCTPTDFLRNYRLKRATNLLKQRTGTISEVAYATGFTSPAYFTRCFKSVYTITPSEYVDSLEETAV